MEIFLNQLNPVVAKHSEPSFQQKAEAFIKLHNLPIPDHVKLDSAGNVVMNFFRNRENPPFAVPPEGDSILAGLEIVLPASGEDAYAIADWYDPWYGDDNHALYKYSLDEIGLE